MLLDEPLAGLPRVYGVAWAFVAHTDSAFDDDLLAHFLTAYQDIRPLNLGELWALPTTLRVVLIENLRRLAEGVATAKAARELADLWCDRIEKYGDSDVDGLFDDTSGARSRRAFARRWRRGCVPIATRTSPTTSRQDAIQAALARALPDPAGARCSNKRSRPPTT